MDESVLKDDSECPRAGRGSRTPAVRARSSSSQPVAVGSLSAAAGPARIKLDRSGILEVLGHDSMIPNRDRPRAQERRRAQAPADYIYSH